MNIPKEFNGTMEDKETFKTAMEMIEDEFETINEKFKLLENTFKEVTNDLNARISILEAKKC